MPWHLLFESFNPAAVSGLCHAMGSVGVLCSSCEDLMVGQFSELKLFNQHFGLKWSWWIAWLIRCHRPLISPQNRSCLAQKLGPLAWRYDTMGGGWQGARQGVVQGCWEMSTYIFLSTSYITKNTQKLLFWNSVAIRNPEFVETLIDCFISWDVIPQPDLFRLDPVVRAGSWVNRIVLLTGRVWGLKRWETNWWLVI